MRGAMLCARIRKNACANSFNTLHAHQQCRQDDRTAESPIRGHNTLIALAADYVDDVHVDALVNLIRSFDILHHSIHHSTQPFDSAAQLCNEQHLCTFSALQQCSSNHTIFVERMGGCSTDCVGVITDSSKVSRVRGTVHSSIVITMLVRRDIGNKFNNMQHDYRISSAPSTVTPKAHYDVSVTTKLVSHIALSDAS